MGITPESAYGVEDSYNGMRSLHAAGLHPIMVPDLLEANEEMQSLAEVILPDLIEVRDYLKMSGIIDKKGKESVSKNPYYMISLSGAYDSQSFGKQKT